MSLEGYDLVMLGILAAAALLGYFKGIVWQLAWIAGIVVSGYAAFRFGGVVAPFFGNQAPWNRFAAMLAIYAGSSVAVWLVFRVISKAISAVHLSAFDHQLGLLLGLAKGALLCVVVTFFSVTLAPAYRHQIVASRSGRLVAELIVRADTYLPKEIHETVDPFVKQFERQFQEPAGMPAAAMGQSPGFAGRSPSPPSAQPSPLKAMWDGVTSAAAWAGTEQGAAAGQGATQAGGVLPAGTAWFVPRDQASAAPAAAPATRYAQPSAGGFGSPQRFTPPPATAPMPPQPFAAQPFQTQPMQTQPMQTQPFAGQPPAAQPRYPVGAQSPLPPR